MDRLVLNVFTLRSQEARAVELNEFECARDLIRATMMYGDLMGSRVGRARDFIKGSFLRLARIFINRDDVEYAKAKCIKCAYLFSAAKLSRTASADAELVSQRMQPIRASAVLWGTECIHYEASLKEL